MKKLISIIILITLMFSAVSCTTKTTDKKLIKNYCHAHYNNYKVVYLDNYDYEKITHRKDNKVVYIVIEKSISSGEKDSLNGMYWGYIKGQNYYKTWYNTKVEKGKTVTSYYIYNPYTNYEDDIVAVVDNNKIR